MTADFHRAETVIIAQTLKKLYPQNPDIVLGREARAIVEALAEAGYYLQHIDGSESEV